MKLSFLVATFVALLPLPCALAEATPSAKSMDLTLLDQINSAAESAVDNLAEGNLRRGTVAYVASVRLFAQLADQMAEQSRQQGGLRTRLVAARAEVDGLANAPTSPLATAASPQSLADLRGAWLTNMQTLRNQSCRARTEADRRRFNAKHQQVQQRLRLMDELLASWSSHRRMDSRLPVRSLLDRVELAELSLPMDEQLYQLAGTMVGETIHQAEHDFGRVLTCLSIGQQVPVDQLAATREMVAHVRQVMDGIRRGRAVSLTLGRGGTIRDADVSAIAVNIDRPATRPGSVSYSAADVRLAQRLHGQIAPLLAKCRRQISPDTLAVERQIGQLRALETLAVNQHRSLENPADVLAKVRQRLTHLQADRARLLAGGTDAVAPRGGQALTRLSAKLLGKGQP